MKKSYIPDHANALLFTTVMVANLAALFLLPGLLVRNPAWGWLVVGIVWLTLVQWALIHESIHKIMFSNARANEWGGRVLSILMGTSFHALRFGHLMHHQHNRTLQPEVTIESPLDWLRYYGNLVFGVYLYEICSGLMLTFMTHRTFIDAARAIFIRGREDIIAAGERFFYARKNVDHVRLDVIAGLLLYGGAFYVYGTHWAWLAAIIAVRGFVLSFMDNIYHYATPRDNSKAGKELTLPPLLSALMLYGNYHETHHLNPNIPWPELPATHATQRRAFDGSFINHGLLQFQTRRSQPVEPLAA